MMKVSTGIVGSKFCEMAIHFTIPKGNLIDYPELGCGISNLEPDGGQFLFYGHSIDHFMEVFSDTEVSQT